MQSADDDENRDLVTVTEKFVKVESYVELFDEFLRRRFLSPPTAKKTTEGEVRAQ